MSTVTITGSNLGTGLTELLECDEIEPGADASYQLCKTIYTHHPLGAKLAEAPIAMAQSQPREIAVSGGPEERLKKAFIDQWKADNADKQIFNVLRLSRIYGVASLALMPAEGQDSAEQVDFASLYKVPKLRFNVFDPLNTAGSLVLSQQPNDREFLKVSGGIRVNGQAYHASRVVVKLNEEPIYLEWTASSFGYVGRSVYQRALFPLKSFVQTMRTDDLVSLKAGVLIAKMVQAGSIVIEGMRRMFGLKSAAVKQAKTYNVITISPEENIETLNLQNLDGAYGMARTNILKNIATAADMPARLLENETMVSGFGEGTEDAKNVAMYIARYRIEIEAVYDFMDKIIQHRAWSPDFYAALQADVPDYEGIAYNEAFYCWRNSFTASWRSLLQEPESEKAKVDDIKLKAIIATAEVLMPRLDPPNVAKVLEWLQDNINENKTMFTVPLDLDFVSLENYEPPVADNEPTEPRPFAAQDSAVSHFRVLA